MLRGILVELFCYILGYFIFILLIILISKRIKNKKLASAIIVILLVIYASIRYNVGSDYDTYFKQYSELPKYFNDVGKILKSDVQHGLTIFMYILRRISASPLIFFFVHALLLYPAIMHYIYKETKNFSWSVFLYFTLQFHMISLNLMKQVISMTILLYNKGNIAKNKIIHAIILSYFMIVFHVSSIVSIIVMFISKYMKPTFKKYFISIIISIIILIVYKQLLPGLGLELRYWSYVENINHDYYIVTIGAVGYLLAHLLILFILLKKRDQLIEINKENKMILSALILSIPFKVLAIDNFPIYRLSLYIDQFLIILIPDYINIRRSELSPIKYRYFCVSLAISLIFLLVFEIVFIPHNNFYSYQTIFLIGQ